LPNPLLALRNLTLKGWRRATAVHKPLVRGARRRAREGERDSVTRDVAAIEAELAAIAAAGRPIVAGPWLAEVGYEALYWAPFLRWYQDAYRIPRERLTILSRGGTRDWYADFADGYVEIFDLLTPAALREGNDARRAGAEGGGRKQSSASAMDEELLRLALGRHPIGDAVMLHPSLMFRLFRHVWHDALPYDYFWTHTRYRLLGGRDGPPLHARGLLPQLPPGFSVAKFYSGVAMPPDPATRARLRELVAREAAVRPVVMLDTGVAVDEHEDYPFEDIPGVVSARGWMTPANNLGVQTALIASAHTFLTTCGGLAWLGPFLGTPTVAVYADDRQLAPHLYVARQAGRRLEAAAFLPLDLRADATVGRA
jgi:hypothetical protein